MKSQKMFNYVKIYDKDYTEFLRIRQEILNKDDVTKDVIVYAPLPTLLSSED